jgi:hypothetical protein
MPDGHRIFEFREDVLIEDISDKPHRLMAGNNFTVGGGNARRFLSAVLKCENTEVGKFGCFRMHDAKNAATIFTDGHKSLTPQNLTAFAAVKIKPQAERINSNVILFQVGFTLKG